MIKTKKIKDFDNYFIEENGEVLNIKTGNKLKASISEGGYVYFRLSVNGKKFLRYQHRLVAETFLPSLYINKTNFSSKEVYQYNLEGDFLNNYRSTKEVERILKLDSSSVAKCCRGILKTCGGYIFRYKKNDQSKKLNDYPKA